jgi:hypothetical protein
MTTETKPRPKRKKSTFRTLCDIILVLILMVMAMIPTIAVCGIAEWGVIASNMDIIMKVFVAMMVLFASLQLLDVQLERPWGRWVTGEIRKILDEYK